MLLDVHPPYLPSSVNNVCLHYDHPQYFSLVPHQCMWQVVDVNVTAITVMTHMLLPQMIKRQKGAIINISSVSACTPPVPLTAEYTASMVSLAGRQREVGRCGVVGEGVRRGAAKRW